jgi:dTDP-4-dehydrorhamnose 3,5-epimerase
MKLVPGSIHGAHVVDIEPIVDERGFFGRIWCEDEFAAHGLTASWAQSNLQFSPRRGTLRGLHYQADPHSEVKLVRCTSGAVFDVAVDLRPSSPTYLEWMGTELTAENRRLVWVPEGCAHGYLTLAAGSEVYYLTSHPYVPDAATGVRYDDPAFAIDWPGDVEVIAPRDLEWPDFRSAVGGGP